MKQSCLFDLHTDLGHLVKAMNRNVGLIQQHAHSPNFYGPENWLYWLYLIIYTTL